jgi:hypothetical protein
MGTVYLEIVYYLLSGSTDANKEIQVKNWASSSWNPNGANLPSGLKFSMKRSKDNINLIPDQ